jgi:predicted RNA-binding Zn-ribbon protein involved in translation (DUF1610 family)
MSADGLEMESMDSAGSAGADALPAGERTSRKCPDCGSAELRRSRRHGMMERVILPFLGWSPYRCDECDTRFYRRTRGRHHKTSRSE